MCLCVCVREREPLIITIQKEQAILIKCSVLYCIPILPVFPLLYGVVQKTECGGGSGGESHPAAVAVRR